MAIQKNDFIELEFTGRVKDGNIFDTNIPEEAKKIGLEIETRPLVICIGQNMILPAIDEFLTGKETGGYSLELKPENAFGPRDPRMIKTMPMRIFQEKQVYPQIGMVFQFDTLLGRISAVSGGRVIVDFNNPLAGKEVTYSLNVKKKLEDLKEKARVLVNFYLRRDVDFEIKENKLVISVEKQFIPLVEFFKDRFKEILNLDLETLEKPEVKEKPVQKSGKIQPTQESI